MNGFYMDPDVGSATLLGFPSFSYALTSIVGFLYPVSDLFKLNQVSALHLLLHGEEQLPQYPGEYKRTVRSTLKLPTALFLNCFFVVVVLVRILVF